MPDPKNCDISVKRAIQGLSKKLGYTATPSFESITLTDLTLDDLDTNTITIKDSDGNIVVYADVNEFYFVAETAVAIADGMSIGLLLSLTYNV